MKNFFIWLIAIIITLTAVVYQRMTGPTNPVKTSFNVESTHYSAKFPRSLETLVGLNNLDKDGKTSQLKVEFEPSQSDISLFVLYRRYPGDDSLTTIEAVYNNGAYIVEMPSQPPAGKIIYYPLFVKGDNKVMPENENGIILRFKAPVSATILIPHIFFMFVAMLFSNLVGIFSFFNVSKASKYALVTIITLIAGGLLFGPLVQKAAFGAYWTGWPFGSDLTDTKTFVAVIVWIAAWLLNYKTKKTINRRYFYAFAAAITLLIYTIPHSTAGSEFNYETGVVVTGTGN